MSEIKIDSLKKIKQKGRLRNFFEVVGAGFVMMGMMAGVSLALVATEMYVLISKGGGFVFIDKTMFTEMFAKFLFLMFALFLVAWFSFFVKSVLKKRKLGKIGKNPVNWAAIFNQQLLNPLYHVEEDVSI